MSLLRLLAVGESLTGIMGEVHRYELKPQGLPRFNSETRRPARTDAISLAVPKRVSPDSMAISIKSVPGPDEGVIAKTNLAAELSTKATLSSGFSRMSVRKQSLELRKGWLLLLLRFFGRGRREGNSRRLVQGELSLEGVKVVRNDLNESDVELVRAPEVTERTEIASKSNEAKPKTVPSSRGGTKWNELTVRLFEVGRSRFS
jgi:hypothetical protein